MSFLYCKFCNTKKEKTEFHRNKNSDTGRTNKCKECCKRDYVELGIRDKMKFRWDNDVEFRERSKERRIKNRKPNTPDRVNAIKLYKRGRRKLLLAKYGGKCECCGEDKFEFLAIDHRNGDGHIERKTISAARLHTILLDTDGILPQYRILCHNCNLAMGFYGYCPHNIGKE